jgi:hypothetical protein
VGGFREPLLRVNSWFLRCGFGLLPASEQRREPIQTLRFLLTAADFGFQLSPGSCHVFCIPYSWYIGADTPPTMTISPGLADSHRLDNPLSIGVQQSSSWLHHPASGRTPISHPFSDCMLDRRPPSTGRRPGQTQAPSPLQGSVFLGGTMRTHGDPSIPSASAGFSFAWFLRGDRFRSENAKDQNSLRNRKRTLLNYELCCPRKSKVPISSGLHCVTPRGATLAASCPRRPTVPAIVAVQGG